MVDYVPLTINMTPEQQQRFEEQAKKHGYTALDEYFLALAELAAEAEEDNIVDPVEGFRLGWRDAMTGNTIPASDLLKALDEDE